MPALFWRFVVPEVNEPVPPLKMRPLAPPFDETLVKVRPSVVFVSVAATPVPVVVMLPVVALNVPPLLALRPAPTEFVTVSEVKLVVAAALLDARLTPAPAAFLLTVAAAKLKLAPAGAFVMSMPLPPGFVTVVLPATVSEPPTVLRATPAFAPVFDAER